MIPLVFAPLLPVLLAWLPLQPELDDPRFAGLQIRRKTPSTRPNRFILLREDKGRRTQEVHRFSRISVQVWATINATTDDWDVTNALASATQAALERFPSSTPLVSAVTDSNGSYPVRDESGVEYQYLTIEYQLRGAAA